MTKPFNEIDRHALTRALEAARASSNPLDREHIEAKLQTEEFFDACEFAAYSQQTDNLHLPPWKAPPCDWDGAGAVDPEVAQIIRRLRRYNLSLFEPDPIAAIEAARRRGGT